MKKNRRLIICLIIAIAFQAMFLQPAAYVYALDLTEISDNIAEKVDLQLQSIDFSELDIMLEEFSKNQGSIFGSEKFASNVSKIIKGEQAVNYENFFQAILGIILDSALSYAPLFALIVGVGVLCSLIGNLKSKFKEKSVEDIVHLVCFCIIVIVCCTAVKTLFNSTTGAVAVMKKQMDIIFPILLTLMTATGSVASVGVYQPAVAVLTSGITQLISYVLLPLFIFSFVFCIIGNLSGNVKLDKFNTFFFSLFKWIVGIVFTVFFAFLSIQGISAGSFDSVSIRTAKFSLRSYVPIMGGYLSEGFDLLMASSILVKNSVGLVGILLLVATVISPIFNILMFSLELKISAAILQPISDGRTSNFLSAVSKTLNMLLTCLIALGFMYVVTTGLIMVTANIL